MKFVINISPSVTNHNIKEWGKFYHGVMIPEKDILEEQNHSLTIGGFLAKEFFIISKSQFIEETITILEGEHYRKATPLDILVNRIMEHVK